MPVQYVGFTGNTSQKSDLSVLRILFLFLLATLLGIECTTHTQSTEATQEVYISIKEQGKKEESHHPVVHIRPPRDVGGGW